MCFCEVLKFLLTTTHNDYFLLLRANVSLATPPHIVQVPEMDVLCAVPSFPGRRGRPIISIFVVPIFQIGSLFELFD